MTDIKEPEKEIETNIIKDSNTSFVKFDERQWKNVEKELDPFQKSIIESLKLLGSNNDTSYLYKNSNIDVCGDDIYEENIRKLLIENDIIIEKKSKNKKSKEKKSKKR